jgi:hypothetical protein
MFGNEFRTEDDIAEIQSPHLKPSGAGTLFWNSGGGLSTRPCYWDELGLRCCTWLEEVGYNMEHHAFLGALGRRLDMKATLPWG